MTNTIDWTKPLELEDGTPVEIVKNYGDGDRLLRRTDGELFTREQASGGFCYPQNEAVWHEAVWHEDGRRFCGYPGLRVRNRIEQPAASTADDVPDWAIEKVLAIAASEGEPVWSLRDVRATPSRPFALVVLELARRIAASEPAPVDPDLVKAREICAWVAKELLCDIAVENYRSGTYDNDPEVQFALSALKEAREQK